MATTHFAVLDIAYEITDTGYLITITTDIPCHLYMRWTLEKPGIHLDPVIKRGLPIHYMPRYCFVVYEDNEQLEPGDTLEHTFEKPNWPVCTTRYFYFWGTIASQPSPSESPIFENHRVVVGPPPPPPLELLFTEPYNVADWPAQPLFVEAYTIDPYPWEGVILFEEKYTW